MPRTTPLFLGTSLLLLSCGARTGLDSESSPDADRPDASLSQPEICNGLDDDLDGEVDEDLPPIRCGQGECEREVPGCLDAAVPVCVPGEPLAEVCNGLDDDCDGLVDEDLGVSEVAGPHVIRLSHEGNAGDCSSCDWASNVGLADTRDGMLAVWRVGFDGSYPEPNVFFRTLNSNGEPLGEIQLLMDENAIDIQLLPATDDRLLLVYCGHFGNRDFIATRFLDENGGLLDEGVRRFESPGCGKGFQGAAESSDYYLTAVLPGVQYPVYERLDSEARSLWIQSVEIPEAGRIELAASDDAIGLITSAGLRAQGLEFQLRSAEGELLSGPLRFGHDSSSHYGPIIAPHREGWLVFAYGDFPGGLVRARLSTEGEVTAGPDALFRELLISRMRIKTYGDGYLFWGYASGSPSTLFLWRLDENGDVTDEWDMPESSFRGAPAVVIRGSRIFMLYSTGDFSASEVQLREFGCLPAP